MAAEATARESRTRVPLRWRDLDMLGHLNQAVYHELLEEGRAGLFAALGGHDFPFVLARVELDYRHEVTRVAGHVDVVSRVARLGRTSVTTEERIELPDGTVAAEGKAVLVAWDTEARGARELSEAERAALTDGGPPA
jgi:acyl-CoA thioester hydrolase